MHDGYKSEESLETVIKHFKLPDAKYAPYAFWFFDQSPATVGAKAQEMAHELARHGFNPGYAHARVNYAHEAYPDDREIFPITKKEWLSDEWFRLFSEQLSQAGSDGCHFSFTDDFDWPSLQAGKKLVEEDPSLKAKSLWYTYFDAAKGETVRFDRGFFAVVGKKAAEEQVPFVELCGKSDGVWKQRRYYCDQTPPAGDYSIPLNMASAYSEAKNCRADYHFYLPQGGVYTL
ncbi:MAG: hypothetical protein IJT66_01150, partial [Clostridia bacterium]|nr:hypothetical protein [Clostridia bacterium]